MSAVAVAATEEFSTDDPAFGIWRDREDMADLAAYVRKLRAPRYNRDGSHNEARRVGSPTTACAPGVPESR